MDTNLLIFTTYELCLSFIFGILTVYLCLVVINRAIVKGKFFDLFLKEGNIAIAIFEGALVFCVLLLVSESIRPAVDTLRTMVLATGSVTREMFVISLGYFFTFYILSLTFSSALLAVSFYVFINATTHVDEILEMKKNHNMAVAILVSVVIISITLFIRPAFDNFIGSLIDYNALENLQPFPVIK